MDYYGEYAERIEALKERLEEKIDALALGLDEPGGERGVEHILGRVKSAESAAEKLKRKGYPEGVTSALTNLSDIIGIRCVTHFVGDVYKLVKLIEDDEELKVCEVKDYIASPKKNGYRSLHMIVEVPFDDEQISSVRVELQFRTIAMDCWAALEHEMRYKKDVSSTELIGNELKRCADEMASIDLSMQTIRDMIRGEF
ncbi:MAG: GTP pyrophosphokinase family protein [Lachnospiraceae bacterium]|nr:GTP pyrophosphokinase family protein [Lachnospiraceae bacterium]